MRAKVYAGLDEDRPRLRKQIHERLARKAKAAALKAEALKAAEEMKDAEGGGGGEGEETGK